MAADARGLSTAPDAKARCFWCGDLPDYVEYHDTEWGHPVTSDQRLFEKLTLEGFQSGLSWLTILRKRENFRRAFHDFDIARVARITPKGVERLLQDAGIVRHRGKIESTINNAKRAADLIDERGSLAAYCWSYEAPAHTRPATIDLATLKSVTTSAESVALSKDLKRRGWSFVGPTTMYAFMQAMGLVNDHIEGCHARAAVEQARAALLRPTPTTRGR